VSVIANTTVVSNFACIEQLDILRQLYGTIYISIEVYEVLAIERNICTLGQANFWLNRMIEQDYKSPVNDLTSLLNS
jgi:predicted nucleic acid-binding protein